MPTLLTKATKYDYRINPYESKGLAVVILSNTHVGIKSPGWSTTEQNKVKFWGNRENEESHHLFSPYRSTAKQLFTNFLGNV